MHADRGGAQYARVFKWLPAVVPIVGGTMSPSCYYSCGPGGDPVFEYGPYKAYDGVLSGQRSLAATNEGTNPYMQVCIGELAASSTHLHTCPHALCCMSFLCAFGVSPRHNERERV
jgi:hypothetical protein